MYIDCHAHLFFSPIPTDAIDKDITGEIPKPTIDFINRLVSSARNKDVSYIVGVINNPSEFSCYKMQLKLENIINVIGISRNNAINYNPNMLPLLTKEIEKKNPHGIGEIGLDYSYGFDKLNEKEQSLFVKNQKELFIKQIQIAKEIDIPIVVHAGYRTDKDIVDILKQEKVQDIGGQIHGYMSQMELVSELLDLGFYFSFGYLHPRDKELKEIVKITPLEQILTETDSPYHLIDSPKRFILPEHISLVTKDITYIKDVELKDFTKQVIRNAKNLFRY